MTTWRHGTRPGPTSWPTTSGARPCLTPAATSRTGPWWPSRFASTTWWRQVGSGQWPTTSPTSCSTAWPHTCWSCTPGGCVPDKTGWALSWRGWCLQSTLFTPKPWPGSWAGQTSCRASSFWRHCSALTNVNSMRREQTVIVIPRSCHLSLGQPLWSRCLQTPSGGSTVKSHDWKGQILPIVITTTIPMWKSVSVSGKKGTLSYPKCVIITILPRASRTNHKLTNDLLGWCWVWPQPPVQCCAKSKELQFYPSAFWHKLWGDITDLLPTRGDNWAPWPYPRWHC